MSARISARTTRLLAWPLGLLLALFAASMPACGGVGTDGTGQASTINVGAVTGLSDTTLTVNGVVFERGSAKVTDAFGLPLAWDALRPGMWLAVEGLVNEDGSSAVAVEIHVRLAVRGTVSTVDQGGATLTVLGSTVRYDTASTVVDGVDVAGAIQPGDVVEVHGPLAAGDEVDARRIERVSPSPAVARSVELRGRVSGLDVATRTMTVGRQRVSYATATLTLRQALANGQVVRVAAATGPTGGQQWVVERMTSDLSLPDQLGFVYVEGVTTDFAAGPTFGIEGIPVDATAANNRNAVTGNGQRVAVIGSIVGGTIRAKSVARSNPGEPIVFVLASTVTGYMSPADFRVRGVLVDASGAALIGGALGDLADGRRVRVTGPVVGRRLVATKLEFL
jgi:Domain of unknown function (DUF5666)